MRIVLLWCLWVGWAQAVEISGRLINGSTGGEGAADEVRLVSHQEMMATVTALKDVRGSFVLSVTTTDPPNRFLVQAIKGRVVYSQGVRSYDEEVVLTVFDAAPDVPISLSLNNMAIFAYGAQMDVGCFYTIDNSAQPPQVLEVDGPTLRFPLIDGVERVQVSTKLGDAMSLRQSVEVEGQEGSISYPLKPGQTQMIVTATRAYDRQNTTQFSLALPTDQTRFSLVVMPRTMEVSGPGVVFESSDDAEDLNVYSVTPGASRLVLDVRGVPAEAQAGKGSEAAQPHGEIRSVANELDRWRWPIVGLLLLVLGLALLRGLWRS